MRTILLCGMALLLPGCSLPIFDTANVESASFSEGPHALRCTAKVEGIADTGETINDDPVATLTLAITPPTGPTYESKINALVSRLNIPRLGDTLPVVCDPDRPQNTKLID